MPGLPVGDIPSSARMPSGEYALLMAPVLASLRTATHDCGDRGHGHYRAWHAWAVANFKAAEHYLEKLRSDGERGTR